jgi:hypothetical protein
VRSSNSASRFAENKPSVVSTRFGMANLPPYLLVLTETL